MKPNGIKCLFALAVFVSVIAVAPMRAQDKPPAPQEAKKAESSLKVSVVVTEMDGAKKISSLPYTFFVNVDDAGRRPTSVRVGLRVPIATGTFTPTAPAQFQYMDIGTNLDCTAFTTPDNRYKLALSVEVSYLSSIDEKKPPVATGENLNITAGNPIVQRFTSSYNLLIRDGQTIEATSTTDPVSGRVLQISVTANSVK